MFVHGSLFYNEFWFFKRSYSPLQSAIDVDSRAVRSIELDISDEASRLAATILNARLAYRLERNPDENLSNHYECSLDEGEWDETF